MSTSDLTAAGGLAPPQAPTKPIHIDRPHTLRLVLAVVTEAGLDHRCLAGFDEEMRYARDGDPDCLVGRVLSCAGVPTSVISELDGVRPNGIFGVYVPGVVFTEDARVALSNAQLRQDSGMPWGSVLAHAIDDAEEDGVDPGVVAEVRAGLEALRGGRS